MVKKTEEGICPVCGDVDIDYLGTDFDSPFIFYNCVCRQCEAQFVEVYKMEYDGFNMDDEDGNEHLYDAEGNEL